MVKAIIIALTLIIFGCGAVDKSGQTFSFPSNVIPSAPAENDLDGNTNSNGIQLITSSTITSETYPVATSGLAFDSTRLILNNTDGVNLYFQSRREYKTFTLGKASLGKLK